MQMNANNLLPLPKDQHLLLATNSFVMGGSLVHQMSTAIKQTGRRSPKIKLA